MKQTLHIFLNDARRLWPEIFLSLVLVAGFVLTAPYKWANPNDGHYSYLGPSVMQLLAYFVELLVPIGWWLLIARAVHSERLVGDRQFWITRPYEWKKLLAAKLLFLVVFLYLPFFAAQSLMLIEAGIAPASQLRGVAYNLLLISGILVLPLVAIATVTRNLARMTLTLLGTLACLWFLLVLATLISARTINSPVASVISFVLTSCAMGAAILLQYAVRRTALSRTLLIATPVLLVAVQLLAPGQPDVSLMNRTYPMAEGTGAPLQISYNPQATPQASAFVPVPSNSVGIQIPIQISGIATGTFVDIDDVKVEIEATDGSHWRSSWQPLLWHMHTAKDSSTLTNIVLPLKVFEEFKSAPLTMHLNLALTQRVEEKVTRMSNPGNEYSIPNIGNCKLNVLLSSPDPVTGIVKANNDLDCRFGLYVPPTHVTTSWTYKPCQGAQADLGAAMPHTYGDYWAESVDATGLVLLPLIPFQSQNYTFSNSLNGGPDKKFCPDTPSVTFTQYALLRRSQAEVTIQGFHLPAPTEGQMTVIENR
jgi:hypothetical protein